MPKDDLEMIVLLFLKLDRICLAIVSHKILTQKLRVHVSRFNHCSQCSDDLKLPPPPNEYDFEYYKNEHQKVNQWADELNHIEMGATPLPSRSYLQDNRFLPYWKQAKEALRHGVHSSSRFPEERWEDFLSLMQDGTVMGIRCFGDIGKRLAPHLASAARKGLITDDMCEGIRTRMAVIDEISTWRPQVLSKELTRSREFKSFNW